jgi:hypothetical protein
MYTDGTAFSTGGLDMNGFAYSATLLGTTQTSNGVVFNLGPANTPNGVANATVSLPQQNFSTLNLLATGINGNQTGQSITVTYTDGTTSTFSQGFADWHGATAFPGQSKAVTMAYRNIYNGTDDDKTFNVYSYAFSLNNTKKVQSIQLPANANVITLAITLQP